MSLTAYEIDKDWVFPSGYVNAYSVGHYVGWRLGVNDIDNLALWTFLPITPSPIAIEDLLPVDYKEITVTQEINKYGYTRNVLPNLSFLELETELAAIASDLNRPVGIVDDEAPSIPANLSVDSFGSDFIEYLWDASTDNVAVTGYELLVNSIPFDVGNVTTYLLEDLPSDTYYAKVRAYDAEGNYSDYSDEVTQIL